MCEHDDLTALSLRLKSREAERAASSAGSGSDSCFYHCWIATVDGQTSCMTYYIYQAAIAPRGLEKKVMPDFYH